MHDPLSSLSFISSSFFLFSLTYSTRFIAWVLCVWTIYSWLTYEVQILLDLLLAKANHLIEFVVLQLEDNRFLISQDKKKV